jgi:hypothetical protein
MQEILKTNYGLAQEKVVPMIEAYLKLLVQIPADSDKPRPNFRNLIALATADYASESPGLADLSQTLFHKKHQAESILASANKRRCIGFEP